MINRRRALGDITNSTANTNVPESKENGDNKKPASTRSVFAGAIGRAASSILPGFPSERPSSIVAPAPAPITSMPSMSSLPSMPPTAPFSSYAVAPAPPTAPMTFQQPANFADRPYMNRDVDDIDSRDAGNPLLCTGYVNDLYDHFHQMEREHRVNSRYMDKQELVNEKMRGILVDWLVEVHLKFKMVPESLYITVQVIDRYLSVKSVRRSRLQLVGVAAILVAAKYEEIFPPELKELVFITDKAYSKQEILEMEADILTTLDYRITVPTIHSFLCRYLKAAHADRPMVQMSCYLSERTLQEYSMLNFLPSEIAATAVMVARMTLKRHPWSPTLLKYSGYDEPQLRACAEAMRMCIEQGDQKQQAVARKYSSVKFGGVAKVPLIYSV